MYAKMKELGPVGGVRRARPLDPPMCTYTALFLHEEMGREGLYSYMTFTLMPHKNPTAAKKKRNLTNMGNIS